MIKLTPREKEVLLLTTQGMSMEQVAKHLDIAPTTVNRHLHAVYAKLGIAPATTYIAIGRTN